MNKSSYTGISRDEMYLISRAEYEKRKLITTAYVRGLFNRENRASQLLASLLRKKRLIRIEKGKYILVPVKAPGRQWLPNEYVVAALWMGKTPYYIGYFTMYHYWGFTDQVPQTIFVLNTKKFSRKNIGGIRYEAIKIDQSKYFGTTEITVDGEKVIISDKERTLVDLINKPIGSFGHLETIIKDNLNKIDLAKFIDYLERFPVVSVRKRAGYILGKIGCSAARLRRLKKSLGKKETYVTLDPANKSRRGRIDKEWKLIVNR